MTSFIMCLYIKDSVLYIPLEWEEYILNFIQYNNYIKKQSQRKYE